MSAPASGVDCPGGFAGADVSKGSIMTAEGLGVFDSETTVGGASCWTGAWVAAGVGSWRAACCSVAGVRLGVGSCCACDDGVCGEPGTGGDGHEAGCSAAGVASGCGLLNDSAGATGA